MSELSWKLRSKTPPPTDKRIWIYVEGDIQNAHYGKYVRGRLAWMATTNVYYKGQDFYYLLEHELNLPEDV